MDVRFDELFEEPENEIFRIVFFPDRIYHARYLSATRSSRYRYAVSEVRSNSKVTAMKGTVFLGGEPLCSLLRLEYSAASTSRGLPPGMERGSCGHTRSGLAGDWSSSPAQIDNAVENATRFFRPTSSRHRTPDFSGI